MARKQQRIVDEQIRTWRFEQQALRRRSDRPRFWPIITISRQYGARGRALAEVLSDRVGFTLWDRELVEAIADMTGTDSDIVELLDERHRKAMHEMAFAAVIGARHSTTRYYRTLVHVVQAITKEGGSIIVGRGGSYICKPSESLNVRVVSPLDQRVRDYVRRESLDQQEARRIITERDQHRADFVRHHFRQDVSEPTDYDLVVNSGTYDLDAMAEIVLAAYEAKFDARPPTVSAPKARSATPRTA